MARSRREPEVSALSAHQVVLVGAKDVACLRARVDALRRKGSPADRKRARGHCAPISAVTKPFDRKAMPACDLDCEAPEEARLPAAEPEVPSQVGGRLPGSGLAGGGGEPGARGQLEMMRLEIPGLGDERRGTNEHNQDGESEEERLACQGRILRNIRRGLGRADRNYTLSTTRGNTTARNGCGSAIRAHHPDAPLALLTVSATTGTPQPCPSPFPSRSTSGPGDRRPRR